MFAVDARWVTSYRIVRPCWRGAGLVCPVSHPADPGLRVRIEEYYDAVPRTAARAEDFGALTLFVPDGEGWPYYARPTVGWGGGFEVKDVERVRVRQRELGLPESVEWVAETTLALRGAVEASGLRVHEYPLMALDADAPKTAVAPPPDGTSVRLLGPDDPALPAVLALGRLAFAEPGTAVGAAGDLELEVAVRELGNAGSLALLTARIRAGLSVVAAGLAGSNVRCTGQHQPVGAVSEVVGVATLPAARRQGLALAVSAHLVDDARDRGIETIFLSAGDHDVARIYARLGFRPIATALVAEP